MAFFEDDEEFSTFINKLDEASRRDFDAIMFRATLHFHRDTRNRIERLEYRVNILFVTLGFLIVGSNLFVPIISKFMGIP